MEEDMEMMGFLEYHGIPAFPTKEAILAAKISLPMLMGWGDDDFRLFFELNQIPKGPQLILKHAVKAQKATGYPQEWAGGENGVSQPWDPNQGYHQGQHAVGYDGYDGYAPTGEEFAQAGEYMQPWQAEQGPLNGGPWAGGGEPPVADQAAFGGGGLFMPLHAEGGEMGEDPGYVGGGRHAAMQGARGGAGRGLGSAGRGSRGRGRGRGGGGRGATGGPQELMSFLFYHKVTEVESVMSMLGVQTLGDLQELMPEDLEALAMTPLQRRRLLNAIEESKNGAFMPVEGPFVGDPSAEMSDQMSAMEQAAVQQHQLAPHPDAALAPEPAPPNRGWETAEVKAAREAAAQAAANKQGGADEEGLNWQQEMLQQQGGTVTAEEAVAGATSGQVMLSGDWICGKCGEHNFARRTRCWKCRARNTGNAVTVVAPTEKKAGKPGDWDCGKCNAANFARRKACYQCGGPKADSTGKDGQSKQQGQGGGKKQKQQQQAEQKSGEETWDGKKASDWTCTHCSARNFKRNIRCFQCHAARKVSEQGGDRGTGGIGNAANSSGGQGTGQTSAASGASGSGTTATPEQERKAVETLAGMLRKCKNNEQVVSVLVQHFAETHASLKSAVLPRAAVGGPRKWFMKHSDTFQLGAPDNYGQSMVRLKQIPQSAPVAAAGAASQSEEREAAAILTDMLRKCGGEQVVSVLVQHFSMQHPALKNVVLPRGIEGNSRRWLARHSDVFELSALDKDGQSTVRIKQGADKIIEARKQQQLAGAKPPEAVEREAVDVLVGMLRKLGGDQVISVLVQYFSMENPTLKSEVMPRGMAGGPRRWFQEHADIFAVGQPDRDGQTRVGLQSHLLNKPGCD